MGYYIRVLSPDANPVPPSTLIKRLAAGAPGASLSGDVGSGDWRQLVVARGDGTKVCLVERELVGSTGLGREEIDEFLDEMTACFPRSAAAWLSSYLPSVRSIYAIQVLNGAHESGGWGIVGSVKNALWSASAGIIQADLEGFTNEDGYHILWQFSDGVDGEWWMAVLKDGQWLKFQMDLGNKDQRAAFQRGEVPDGVKTIT